MSYRDYEKKTIELISPILVEENAELVDVEFVKDKDNYYLRIYIETDSGVDLDTCERISRKFSDVLDEVDYIDEEYILEISSPGDHPFKTERDYERNIGEYVKITTYEKIDSKKSFSGILLEFKEGNVSIEDDSGETLTLKKETIAKICKDFKL